MGGEPADIVHRAAGDDQTHPHEPRRRHPRAGPTGRAWHRVRVETISSRQVYANSWMTVREDRIRRADGTDGIYGVIDKPTYALVIPRDGDRLHLVEQFRYPVGRRRWEFPAGTAPERAAQDPAELAVRELREETGLVAGRMELIGHLEVAPGHVQPARHGLAGHRADRGAGPARARRAGHADGLVRHHRVRGDVPSRRDHRLAEPGRLPAAATARHLIGPDPPRPPAAARCSDLAYRPSRHLADYEHLLVKTDGDTVRITMNRPERRNALSEPHLRELLDAFQTAGRSDATGIVLAAEGKAFSAGHDFADVAARDLAGVRHLLTPVHQRDAAPSRRFPRW